MLSRGQAWAEYIIILAVVIIMAGIALYLAGGFPSTTQSVEERDSAAYWLSADVGVVRYVANSSMLQLVIKNNRNFRIRVTSITSKGSGVMVASEDAVILEPGQTAQVNITGVGCSSGIYSIPLVINYTDAAYGVQYSFVGEKPLVSRCIESSAISTPPECYSDSECGHNRTPCEPYCDGNVAYLYSSNPVTCQRTCSNGRCSDCLPSCGGALPTDCGRSSYCSSGACIPCAIGYGNCNENPSDSCEVNLQENGSNCGTCGNICGGGQLCCSGVCKIPQCTNNADCNDNNPCTTDVCNNPNTCNAQCTHAPITQCCGNGICEVGEDCNNCQLDCGCVAPFSVCCNCERWVPHCGTICVNTCNRGRCNLFCGLT